MIKFFFWGLLYKIKTLFDSAEMEILDLVDILSQHLKGVYIDPDIEKLFNHLGITKNDLIKANRLRIFSRVDIDQLLVLLRRFPDVPSYCVFCSSFGNMSPAEISILVNKSKTPREVFRGVIIAIIKDMKVK